MNGNEIRQVFYNVVGKRRLIVAKILSEQRGRIAHEASFDEFSDMDARRISFLEILTHAMMLKRLGLDDPDIERIIGVVFSCNYIVFNEQFG